MRVVILLLYAVTVAAGADGATLSGQVTTTLGGPMYPIDIDVHLSSTGAPVAVVGDTTTPAGGYAITLPADVYDVTFVPPAGAHFFRRTIKSINLGVDQVRNVALPRGHYLTGRIVRQSDGSGVVAVNLDFTDPASGAPAANLEGDTTDFDGFFDVLVDSAVFDVSLTPDPVARLVPERIAAVNLTADVSLGVVALEPGFEVRGTVTDDGFFPVADSDLDVRAAGTRTKLFTPHDNTDAGGAWSLILPAGTFDITATPPDGLPLAPVTARATAIGGDLELPNLMLPNAVELRGRCRTGASAAIPGVDVDVDSLPLIRRLETPNDQSDAGGDFRVWVPAHKFRVTLTPPVASRMLPVRYDSLQVGGALDLGNITFAAGHWVEGHVLEAGTGTPVAGANLDLVRVSSGLTAITAGDQTDAAGYFRIVTDDDLYALHVAPPDGDHLALDLAEFRTLADTVVTLSLEPSNVGVGAPSGPARLALAAPWPNPTRGEVWARFAVPDGDAELAVWDVAGRRRATLWRGPARGATGARWDTRDEEGRPVPAGLYFLTLTHDGEHLSRRLVVTR